MRYASGEEASGTWDEGALNGATPAGGAAEAEAGAGPETTTETTAGTTAEPDGVPAESIDGQASTEPNPAAEATETQPETGTETETNSAPSE